MKPDKLLARLLRYSHKPPLTTLVRLGEDVLTRTLSELLLHYSIEPSFKLVNV